MEQSRMMQIALDHEFVQVEMIDTDQIPFQPNFRVACEANECGNYNRNYGCPPFCGTPEQMAQRISRYRHAMVMQSSEYVADVLDDSKLKGLKKNHTARSLQTIDAILKESGQARGLAIMAGPCNLCPKCKMIDGEPCIHEDLRFSCLSAYCVDVTKLAETCHMELSWTGDPVSFFSIYCFDEK